MLKKLFDSLLASMALRFREQFSLYGFRLLGRRYFRWDIMKYVSNNLRLLQASARSYFNQRYPEHIQDISITLCRISVFHS